MRPMEARRMTPELGQDAPCHFRNQMRSPTANKRALTNRVPSPQTSLP